MLPFYTDEIETLVLDGNFFNVGHHQNKQQTILEDNKKTFNNFEFTYQLRKPFVLPKIRQRLENLNGLQIADNRSTEG